LSVRFDVGGRISTLGDHAFSYCSSLQSICIPSSIEVISKCCFACCHYPCDGHIRR
jgi:hypothetical protein